MNATADATEYVPINEGAAILHISHWTLRQYVSKGKLRRFKVGGKTLVLRSELMGLIKEETKADAARRNSKRAAQQRTARKAH